MKVLKIVLIAQMMFGYLLCAGQEVVKVYDGVELNVEWVDGKAVLDEEEFRMFVRLTAGLKAAGVQCEEMVGKLDSIDVVQRRVDGLLRDELAMYRERLRVEAEMMGWYKQAFEDEKKAKRSGNLKFFVSGLMYGAIGGFVGGFVVGKL